MDTARQFLRYSIPGSVFLLWLIGLQIAWNRTLGSSMTQAAAAVSPGVVLAVVAAGIPIGFILYQFYFGRYKPFARSVWTLGILRHPRTDRGAQVLALLSCDQRFALSKRTGQKFDHRVAVRQRRGPLKAIRPQWLDKKWVRRDCPEADCRNLCSKTYPDYGTSTAVEAYRRRWDENWQLVMAIADVQADDQRYAAVKREYTSLSDIYHALGVCRAALFVSTLSWASYNWIFNHRSITDHLGRFAILAGTAIVLLGLAVWYLSAARQQTQQAMLSRLGKSLRALLPK
jgi:hypothetical protein